MDGLQCETTKKQSELECVCNEAFTFTKEEDFLIRNVDNKRTLMPDHQEECLPQLQACARNVGKTVPILQNESLRCYCLKNARRMDELLECKAAAF